MYYCAMYLGVLEHTPQIFCQLCKMCVLAYIFCELSLKKIYNTYLNHIDMVLLCIIAIGTGAFSNFILNCIFSVFWRIHGKTL